MAAERIPLATIQALDAHQAREGLNADTVAAYAQHVIDGGDLPPVILFQDSDGVHYLADGFHRVAAYRAAERLAIPAEVRKGSQRDAFKFALGANEEHGLRRTNADRRRAVTLALLDVELGQLSDRAVAKLCKVSHPFVSKVRATLGKADAALDDVDLWEGETDPEKQLARFLACSDLALVEALWPSAKFATGTWSPAHNHRKALRGIAAAKLHADVAEWLEPERPAVNKAAVTRSQALALYDDGAKGTEAETLATAKEWAKALQFRNLSPYDRLVGLIAQQVKVSTWGGVEKERLLTLISSDVAFVKAIRNKETEARRKQAQEREAARTPWPWPRETEEGEAELIGWFNRAESRQELMQFVESYVPYYAPAWLRRASVAGALRAALHRNGISSSDCRKAECEHGFIVEGRPRCSVCDSGDVVSNQRNAEHIQAVRALLRRGLCTLLDLGIEAAPVVEAPQVETLPPADVEADVEAPQVETLPPADVEADIEAPRYRVAWGSEAEPAKTLCGRIQRAFKDEQWDKGQFFGVYDAWSVDRVVPSPLVKWVPVFDVVGRWLNCQAMACDVHEAARELMPGAPVTPPAVSDTEAPPIAFEDRDLWASCPLARTAFKKLLVFTNKFGKKEFEAAQNAAKVWQDVGEPLPADMPLEVQAVIEALATNQTKEKLGELLHLAHGAGKVALRWINNSEEDEPVPSTPTGRSSRPTKAAKAAELGAAAK